MLELISVHVPKCAGSSFKQTLLHAYGADAIRWDYGDRPADPSAPMNLDPDGFFARHWSSGYPQLAGKRVVHGHFHVGKYRAAPDRPLRIVFLRHPVERTISNYRFWLQFPRHGHALHDYVLDNQLTLVEFAKLPSMRHFYERVFFAGIERSVFDFVGTVEALESDMRRLAGILNLELPAFRENVGPQADAAAPPDPARDELADVLSDDIRFYSEWAGRG